jgi:hypothetical protein
MGKDIIDHDRYQGPSFRDSKTHTQAKCSDGMKDVFFVSPTVISLKPNTRPNIVIDYSEFAIKPNKDGIYHLTYSSFYEDTKTHFSPKVEIILKNEQKCSMDWIGFTKIYLFDYEFKLKQD